MNDCPLCNIGFKLVGTDHVPSQRHGMIPVTRCRKSVKRIDIARYRNYLNFTHTGIKHRNGRFQQRTRAYGDYLYHQDRDKFIADMCAWLPGNPT